MFPMKKVAYKELNMVNISNGKEFLNSKYHSPISQI